MTAVERPRRVQLVDKWSWLVAMSVTIGLFTISLLATLDPQFSAVAAAGAGIGVQFFLPYQARRSVATTEQGADSSDETGGIHQGAAGGAVFVASILAVVVMVVTADSTTALWVGALVLAAVYAALATVLERVPVDGS
ncbi:hypothetical protein [Natronococcus sp. A-GB7]|uniref:hypothetical protein n=1 Tax=Natronococcus sp. A-GB7 TaxID=3037649 RepID=UPI00241FA087|nr:hypothetical protein [Natronococcus sp. A-GB7]MDG5818849.1 hypothetical protein [Natronococcus sp. A-GB7]